MLIDTATEGSDTLQIDQTITAGSIDVTGSGATGGDTLGMWIKTLMPELPLS